VGSKPGHLSEKKDFRILQISLKKFHLSRSCKNSTDKKETLRRMAKPMEFVQEMYKQQITDTSSFRTIIEKGHDST